MYNGLMDDKDFFKYKDTSETPRVEDAQNIIQAQITREEQESSNEN